MPELPEVQTVVTTLAPRVLGRRIERVVHVRDDMVTAPAGFDLAAALAGRTVSPSVYDMMLVLGREETIARLEDASA